MIWKLQWQGGFSAAAGRVYIKLDLQAPIAFWDKE